MPQPSGRSVAIADAALLAGLLRGLAQLAGLADSEVLQGRLRRAGPLLRGLTAVSLPPPDPDHPFWAALLDAVTVQETRLFRAAPQLLALAGLVFPTLRDRPGPWRLLSAGCATGEEAWTLAVLAAEAGQAAEILGLDLCRPALAQAADGRFPPGPPDPLRDVPPQFHRFFAPTADGGVQVRPALGISVRLARANLRDLPPTEAAYDVILCRNVLIYLTDAARLAVLQGLCARLAPGGALLLGATDAPPPSLGLTLWSAEQPSLWRRL